MFIAMWAKVLSITSTATMLRTVTFIVGALAIVLFINKVWVDHNVAIYRRKGPRTGVRRVSPDWSEDFLGRALAADWSSVVMSPRVDVVVRGDRKFFVHSQSDRPAPTPPPPPPEVRS